MTELVDAFLGGPRRGPDQKQSSAYVLEVCADVGDASRHIAELMSNLRADEARLAQSVLHSVRDKYTK